MNFVYGFRSMLVNRSRAISAQRRFGPPPASPVHPRWSGRKTHLDEIEDIAAQARAEKEEREMSAWRAWASTQQTSTSNVARPIISINYEERSSSITSTSLDSKKILRVVHYRAIGRTYIVDEY